MRSLFKIIASSIFFIVSAVFAISQPRTDRSPKQLLLLISESKADKNRIGLQLELGYHYVVKPGAFKDDMDSAFAAFKSALELSIKLKSKKWENETLKLIGDCYLEELDFPHGKACFMQVINYYRRAGNLREQAVNWERFGECIPEFNLQLLQYKRAAYEQARLLYLELHNESGQIKILSYLAGIDYQIQMEKDELQKIDLRRNLAFGGILVFLIVAALVYSSYRQNKKSNSRFQLQQKEINLKNESLQELNDQQKLLIMNREWLLREIHHRVNNNLQTAMSLMNMQTSYLSNADAIDAIRNSQRRMHVMSLVHQRLYLSDNMATIDMKGYIEELVNYLSENLERSEEVKFDLLLEEIDMDLATTIPLGLIINEAVTNAIKYAFPETRHGKIVIRFKKIDGDEILLSVADDGVGLPESVNYETSHSLGLNLIRGLTDQIQGKVEMQSLPGMSLKITFKNIKLKERQFE